MGWRRRRGPCRPDLGRTGPSSPSTTA